MQRYVGTSRRLVLAGFAAAPFISLTSGNDIADSHLVDLGREFDEISVQFDRSIEYDYRLSDEMADRFGEVLDEIEATPAFTIAGLCVKARAACWCLLGDLDTPDKATGDVSMSLSILRDLIRLHRPEMEKPGAISKLLEEIESGAA